jgi:hypothetical protein
MKIELFRIIKIEAQQNWWISFAIGILILAIAIFILSKCRLW